jgi:hypothetical protein
MGGGNGQGFNPDLVRWIRLVWSEDGPRGPAARALCQVLFDFRRSCERIFPSEGELARRVGMSERRVCDHLKALLAENWIQRSRIRNAGRGFPKYEYKFGWPLGFDPKKDPELARLKQRRDDATTR